MGLPLAEGTRAQREPDSCGSQRDAHTALHTCSSFRQHHAHLAVSSVRCGVSPTARACVCVQGTARCMTRTCTSVCSSASLAVACSKTATKVFHGSSLRSAVSLVLQVACSSLRWQALTHSSVYATGISIAALLTMLMGNTRPSSTCGSSPSLSKQRTVALKVKLKAALARNRQSNNGGVQEQAEAPRHRLRALTIDYWHHGNCMCV